MFWEACLFSASVLESQLHALARYTLHGSAGRGEAVGIKRRARKECLRRFDRDSGQVGTGRSRPVRQKQVRGFERRSTTRLLVVWLQTSEAADGVLPAALYAATGQQRIVYSTFP